MVDVVLTRTQRKTPTVIHPGYKISRIRSFYMRKVKFTQQTIDEKLGAILQEFPRLDDIHPFYADLMNVLYDRDHFKLALAQVNTAKNLVQGISKDYLRMMKYGDSLYRCKQLKRAALGRMCTVLMKLKASLGYLEEVRKHISRLPALDPNTRTLLLTGYPNVGKSSFMNKVTRADVDVQAYAFTTKALYVGHMDHRFLRWQVIDTPGILDRPLEERNTIEMQAITALAHLQCCVLYFVDISEECGYTVDAQLALFNSIRPLFANKQVMMVANKTDVIAWDKLNPNSRAAIESCAKSAGAELITMSNVSEDGVSALKMKACDKLLEARVDAKLSTGRVKDDVLSRITVAQPKKRDGKTRGAHIPDSVANAMATEGGNSDGRVTEKQLMINNGGAGVYSCDYRKYYLLEEDEWKGDSIPEFMNGKNVMDFFSQDIEERLKALDEEEAALEAQGAYADSEDDGEGIDEEEEILYQTIKERQETGKMNHRLKKTSNSRVITNRGRTEADMREELEFKGYNADKALESMARGRKRTRRGDDNKEGDAEEDDDAMDEDGDKAKTRSDSVSRSRSKSRNAMRSGVRSEGRARSQTPSGRTEGSVPASKRRQVIKDERVLERNMFSKGARGPADREHYPKKVKHMMSGKRPGYGTKTIGR
jgi:nucleolar GTP-binding protein